MKKAIGFFLTAIAVTLILSGCTDSADSRVRQHDWNRLMLIERYKDFDVYADTETGVEYLVLVRGNRYGITPVLNSDGTPVLAPNFDAMEDKP